MICIYTVASKWKVTSKRGDISVIFTGVNVYTTTMWDFSTVNLTLSDLNYFPL